MGGRVHADDNHDVVVVGAGLAGTECALSLAKLWNLKVKLLEMRPFVQTPAHRSDLPAELVCSNSLGSFQTHSASGALKREMACLGHHILRAALKSQVPAGHSLSVDRGLFSQTLSHWLEQDPRIQIVREEVTSIDDLNKPVVVATGPLTSDSLVQWLLDHFREPFLYFYDATSPIIEAESIDFDLGFWGNRWDEGNDSADYFNIPLTREQYFDLIQDIAQAEKIPPKEFEKTIFFEGCMPIEEMVQRGPLTLVHGPLRPVGLNIPKRFKDTFAVIQLRAENQDKTAFNMVGFQTRMKWNEQTRIFRKIPALRQAEFHRLGTFHKNIYINSAKLLSPYFQSLRAPKLFFAGQITGVEGYFESSVSGWLVAYFVACYLGKARLLPPPRESAIGSLYAALIDPHRIKHFQPMNMNFSLYPPVHMKDKAAKRHYQVERGLMALRNWMQAVLPQKPIEENIMLKESEPILSKSQELTCYV